MIDVVRVALAAWRLSRLLVREDGPGEVFARLRARVGIPQVGHRQHDPISVLYGILDCPFCASVWAAGILWIVRRWRVVDVLAAAGLAALFGAWEDRGD